MKTNLFRLTSLLLALLLTLPGGALAAPGVEEAPVDASVADEAPVNAAQAPLAPEKAEIVGDGAVQPMAVTVPDYTCADPRIQEGGLYTLIALPRGTADVLTPQALLVYYSQAMYVGTALAAGPGAVSFSGIHLRTAQAVDLFITGPGLDTPIKDSTGPSTSLTGKVTTGTDDRSATLTLIDTRTGYRYATSVESGGALGSYLFDDLAPGHYSVQITRPGYIPFVTPDNQWVEVTTGTTTIRDFDISKNLGDVNGDGRRTGADLAALLQCYGDGPLPVRFYADLNGDGTVDSADVALLTATGEVTGGTGTPETPYITVSDSPVSGDDTLRKLTFTASAGGRATLPAAAFSLSFRSDYIQPCNRTGGAIAPVDGSTNANCLTAGAGLTVESPRWSLLPAESRSTLSFCLTAETPVAVTASTGTVLCEFYYRPAANWTTDHFFAGMFTLPHVAALLGEDTVLTTATLEYPNSANAQVVSLRIDSQNVSLPIPAVGQSVALALSASGETETGQTVSDLSGVFWAIQGDTPPGVSLTGGLLTITGEARPGTLSITATRDGCTSPPVVITLTRSDPVATQLILSREGTPCPQDSLTVRQDADAYFAYDLQCLDQYGSDMGQLEDIHWQLTGAPEGVTFREATRSLVLPQDMPAGTYRFQLFATCGEIQGVTQITLTVEPVLGALALSGPNSIAIPQPGTSLLVPYYITAQDLLGQDMELDDLPSLTLTPQDSHVTLDAQDRLVTIASGATPGQYLLVASSGTCSVEYPITLVEAAGPAMRLGLYAPDTAAELTDLTLTTDAGSPVTRQLTAKLLDVTGAPLPQSEFAWELLPGAPQGVTVENGLLSVSENTAAGRYTFRLSVSQGEAGLSTQLPVILTVRQVLRRLAIAGPVAENGVLTLPTVGSAQFVFTVSAYDTADAPMTLPADARWAVTGPDNTPPAGVTLEDGVLTVQSNAAPGPLTLTVTAGEQTVSFPLQLVSSNTTVLQLQRDGRPVSGLDAVTILEGETAHLRYEAYLVNQSTGQATKLDDVTWFNGVSSLTVASNAERGIYSAQITALHEGKSVNVTAQVTVYPDLLVTPDPDDPKEWAIDGLTLSLPSALEVPPAGAAVRVYQGELVAHTTRGEAIPLRELGVDYTLSLKSRLDGVRASYDRETHRLTVTVDTSAIVYQTLSTSSNWLKAFTVTFSYYPGRAAVDYSVPFELTAQKAAASSAVLLAGRETGTGLALYNPPEEGDVLTLAPGTYGNGYVLELRDQYGRAVTGQKVTWSLSGAPAGVTLRDDAPGAPSSKTYTGFTRLSAAYATAPGTYRLTLTARCGAFRLDTPIQLTVTEAAPFTGSISGADSVAVPRYYKNYNSAERHTGTATQSYEALFHNENGNMSTLTVVWSLSGSPTGVTVDQAGKLTVRGEATAQQVTLTASLRDGSTEVARTTKDIALTRPSAVPSLLRITKNGSVITSDTHTVASDQAPNITAHYDFTLVDQYNRPVDQKIMDRVHWSGRGTAQAAVYFADGTLQIQPSKLTQTEIFSVTASLAKEGELIPSDLTATLSLRVNAPGGGGGWGGGGVADIPPDEGAATPSLTLRPALTVSGTTGSVTLTPEEESALLAATGAGGVVIAPTGGEGVSQVTLTLTGATAANLANQSRRSLTLDTPVGKLLLSREALAQAGGTGAAVSITIARTQSGFRVEVRGTNGALGTLSGQNILTAPVSHFTVTPDTVALWAASDGKTQLLRKSVFVSGTLTTPIPATGEIRLENRPHAFTDAKTHWADAAIRFVFARELFQGTAPSLFSPGGDMTRGMVVTVLHRLEDTPAPTRSAAFADVPSTAWFAQAVAWANEKAIVQGTGTGFDPNGPVSREQLATILYRYAPTVGLATTGRSSLDRFPDGGKTSSWAKAAMEWAVSTGLISGKGNGTLDPQGRASRAEVATILQRMVQAMAAR